MKINTTAERQSATSTAPNRTRGMECVQVSLYCVNVGPRSSQPCHGCANGTLVERGSH